MWGVLVGFGRRTNCVYLKKEIKGSTQAAIVIC
jgi:hypothetical protein